MNSKTQIYIFAISSIYFLFIGVVIGQNFLGQSESKQFQASVITPTTATATRETPRVMEINHQTSSDAKPLTTSVNLSSGSVSNAAQSATTSAVTSTSLNAIRQQLLNRNSGIATTSSIPNTNISATQLTNGNATSNISNLTNAAARATTTATAAAQSAIAQAAAATTERNRVNSEISGLNLPGVDVSKLTDAQKKILSERLATARNTNCTNVASGGVDAATACPGATAQIGNIAGIQQSIPNANLPSGISALSGLSGIASRLGVSNLSNLSSVNLSSLSSAAQSAASSYLGGSLGGSFGGGF